MPKSVMIALIVAIVVGSAAGPIAARSGIVGGVRTEAVPRAAGCAGDGCWVESGGYLFRTSDTDLGGMLVEDASRAREEGRGFRLAGKAAGSVQNGLVPVAAEAGL